MIAVVGGDGSLSEVITGRMLLNGSQKETFAIIPAGTGNSQAHDLKITSTENAVHAIVSGRTQALDLAKVELTEGLPGETGGGLIRYSHNLVTWGLGVDSIHPSRENALDGTRSIRCWHLARHHGKSTTNRHPFVGRSPYYR